MPRETDHLLGITKAARLLGVHPLTLRSWAEKGHIPHYRTPGGHRRFHRKDLDRFLATMNQSQSTMAFVSVAHQAVQNAIATLPRQEETVGPASPVWRSEMSVQQRDAMRSIGRKLLGLVIQYTAGNADEAVLSNGREIGASYGLFSRQKGMSVSETVATFNFFRDTIIDVTFESPSDAVDIDASSPQLYRRLNHFMSEVLLATVQAFEEPPSEIEG